MKKLILISSLFLAACGPKIADPRIEFPTPPPALMEPAKTPQTIPTGE